MYPNLPYPSEVYIPFAIFTAEEVTRIDANIKSLANGSGFNAGSIDTPALAAGAVTSDKIDFTTLPSAQQVWQTPTLQGTWVNFGTPYAPARYMKDSFGFVHIEGLVRAGGTENVFILPVGYRPSTNQGLYFTAPTSGGHGDLVITGTGQVAVYGSGRGTYSSIACTFRAGS